MTYLRYGLLFLLIAIGIAGVYALNPPAPLPKDAPAGEFSAGRACALVAGMATEPHRTGTEANDRVRDKILAELARMGLKGEVVSQTTVGMGGFGAPQDIIARLKGRNSTKAFMLAAHYDSVPFGPGAADDLSGVATMLEVCRALQAGPPLRNDVVFLFTDAEERGLLGAYLFRDQGRCADIGMMLNLEARGICGPSYLFETSKDNGYLLPEVLRTVPHPRLNPLIYDVYLKTPFNSDFTVFKPQIPGMNVAFMDGIARYHTRNDNADSLDPGSVQHHGSYALSLARHFGDLDISNIPKAPDVTAFTWFGDRTFHHPRSWQSWLLGATGILFLISLWSGLFHGKMSKAGLLRAILAWCGITIMSLLLLGVLVTIAFLHQWFYMLYNTVGYTMGGYLLIMGVSLLLAWRVRHDERPLEMALGGCAMTAIAAAALWLWLPNSACLVEWPLLAVLSAVVVLPFLPAKAPRRLIGLLLFSAAALPAVLLFPQSLFVIHQGLPMGGLPIGAVFCVLFTALLFPFFDEALSRRTRYLGRTLVTAGLVLVATDFLREGRSADRPGMDCVSYAMNLDTGQALWISSDAAPDHWTDQFFPKVVQRRELPEFLVGGDYMVAGAPAQPLDAPAVTVAKDLAAGDERRLTLQYMPGGTASRVRLRAEVSGQLISVAVNGKPLPCGPSNWNLDYTCLPDTPNAIELVVQPATAAVTLTVAEVSYFLPSIPEMATRPRPSYTIEEPNTVNGDRPFECGTTLTTKQFSF